MKKQRNQILLICILGMVVSGNSSAWSQIKPKNLKVSLLTESISIPFSGVYLRPIHPGISIGTDLMLKDQIKLFRSFGVNAAYYFHEKYEHAFMLDAEYQIGYTFSFKFRTSLISAVGYKHSFLSGSTFVLEEGQYEKKTHLGQSQLNFKIGFGLEYPIMDKLSLTASYLGMIALPYAPDRGMPFATHAFLNLGTKISF